MINLSESFDDDLFAGLEIEPVARERKDKFKPWHNPRKQLVRKEQWIYFIRKHIGNMLADRKVIRYFSLPGDDLLDIRVLHDEVCVPEKIKLNFLGFNDHSSDAKREQDANLSLAEVRSMPFIDRNSLYYHNNILQVGRFKSLAYTRMKDGGDYDIINLDFCDSMTSIDPATGDENHYQLLKNIISIQRSRDEPWLLFITTRIGVKHVHESTLKILLECYKDNLNDEVFKAESKAKYGISNEVELIASLDNPEKFSKIICTSLCKWLLKHTLSFKPQTTVKVLDAMEYKVFPEAQSADMISFALYLKPHPDRLGDHAGLAPGKLISEEFKEPEISFRYINKFFKTTNCDTWLEGNPERKEVAIQESMSLLESARYDVSQYRSHFQ